MSVTEKLLKVYRVDQKIGGLRSRLTSAERFLSEQERHLSEIGSRRQSVEVQLRQVHAVAADAEGEVQRLDARINELRERMNNASTSKEYKAMLAEVNTLKEQRSGHETRALEMLEKVESLRSQSSELGSATEERERVRTVAIAERDQRAEEIRATLKELETEREQLVVDVPAHVLSTYEALVERLEDEAMAPIEVQDRKRHEFTCGNCMMSLPIEAMSTLLGSGDLTLCVSCGCILYLDETAKKQMLSTSKK